MGADRGLMGGGGGLPLLINSSDTKYLCAETGTNLPPKELRQIYDDVNLAAVLP